MSIVAEIQIDHLLYHDILGLNRHDHLSEQSRHINTQRHARNHLLDDVALPLLISLDVQMPQKVLQLVHLALPSIHENPDAGVELWVAGTGGIPIVDDMPDPFLKSFDTFDLRSRRSPLSETN